MNTPLQEAEETLAVPTWWEGMEFCHLDDDTGRDLCGSPDDAPTTEVTCADYDGRAICPTCGNPTCPRCAQLAELDERLHEPH